MWRKFLQAAAAGTAVGVVIQESIWLATDFMTPATRLAQSMIELEPGLAWSAALGLGWLCGGIIGGLMGCLMSNGRSGGYAAALLLALAAWLQTELAWPDPGALRAMALLPILGGVSGTGLGLRVLKGQRRHRGAASLITTCALSHRLR